MTEARERAIDKLMQMKALPAPAGGNDYRRQWLSVVEALAKAHLLNLAEPPTSGRGEGEFKYKIGKVVSRVLKKEYTEPGEAWEREEIGEMIADAIERAGFIFMPKGRVRAARYTDDGIMFFVS